MSSRHTFFATCAPGLEPLLHAEARALALARLERQIGGIRFEGPLADAWRANLELRTAVRVLWRLARFEASDADALYAGVREVDWSRFVAPEGTLRVDAQTRDSGLVHSSFVAQRTKDAICDQLRERTGARPSVERDDPDLFVHVHVSRDRATVSVDTSGASLHKRGWRRYQGRAPLAETLAAGMVLASGWDRRAPLLDPFCGSGTILFEAALLAANAPPGLFRGFAFERLPGHDAAAWAALRERALARTSWPRKLRLLGADYEPEHVAGARENLTAAAAVVPALEGAVELDLGDARDFAPKPGWNAWIVTNPPYGERVGSKSGVETLYERFGALLRERCCGYRLALLTGDPRNTRALGLGRLQRTAWKNGAIDCELVQTVVPER